MPSYRSIANSPTDVLISLFNVHFFIVNLFALRDPAKNKRSYSLVASSKSRKEAGRFSKETFKKTEGNPGNSKKKKEKKKKKARKKMIESKEIGTCDV